MRTSFVGVDAHIDPADCTVFTEIYGEFVTAQRADVGIGPYRTLANPYCLATFERKADFVADILTQLPTNLEHRNRRHAQIPDMQKPLVMRFNEHDKGLLWCSHFLLAA